MIQPINALTPRAGFRGTHAKGQQTFKGLSDSQVALVSAGGFAAAAGGITTIVARSYTNSIAHAGVLGIFASLLSMFFMAPHLIEKFALNKKPEIFQASTVVKQEAPKTLALTKESIKPIRKLVQFRSEKA
jgi:hypothetical protein